MRFKSSTGIAACGLLFGLTAISFAQTGPPNRIVREIDASRATIKGNLSPLARAKYDQGEVQSSLQLSHITMMFSMTKGQQAELDALLKQQQDRNSPNYHHWLTSEEYGKRFGLSSSDLNKIVAWLEDQGFTVDQLARSRTWVAFSGTAAQAEAAFQTAIHRYAASGATHYANVTEPTVPAAFANVILGFRGLNDFRPKPLDLQVGKPRSIAKPDYSDGTGDHALVPADLATIYNVHGLYNSGITGSGVTVAVVGQTDMDMSDIQQFRQIFGLPVNEPTVVLVPGSADPGTNSDDAVEADLDLEWSGAIAPDAGIVYVNSTNAGDSLAFAIDQGLAPVVSISYGGCEADAGPAAADAWAEVGQQANAQGITILAASGDSGAAGCDSSGATNATQGLSVNLPASLPYVTAVGGAEFNEGSGNYWASANSGSYGSALSYIPETAWNDSADGLGLSSGGGGESIYFPKPTWQAGSGVPSGNTRYVPDVALTASPDHDPYLICAQGSCAAGNAMEAGGTSAAAPTFAGIVALIDQLTGSPQGNINPILYPLAQNSPAAFHDVTAGSNSVPCQAGTPDCNGNTMGYNAGPGYDAVTGLGSVDAYNLATSWPSASKSPADFQFSMSPSSLTVYSGGSGKVALSVTGTSNFSGTVQFTCSVASSLAGTNCSVSPQYVAAGGTATLTVTAPATGSGLVFPAAPRGRWWIVTALIVACGILLLLSIQRTRQSRFASPFAKRARWSPALCLILFAVLACVPSCGGGGSPPSGPTGQHASQPSVQTGMVTVQAISGSLSHSAQVAVTVN